MVVIRYDIWHYWNALGRNHLEEGLARLFSPDDVIEIYGKVKAYGTREKVTEVLTKIAGDAREGDTLFGHCRTCRGYPEEFFAELERAGKRGANFMIIVTLTNESFEFTHRILSIGKRSEKYGSSWAVRGFESEEITVRMFGYKSKDGERGEVLIAFPFVNAYIGLHFEDIRIVEYLWPSFMEKWGAEHIKVLRLENGQVIRDNYVQN